MARSFRRNDAAALTGLPDSRMPQSPQAFGSDGKSPSLHRGYGIHTFSYRSKYLELKEKAPLPSRERGWGEGVEAKSSNGFQPFAPSSQPFSRSGEKGFSLKPTLTDPLHVSATCANAVR